jgi:tRNA uracil 4-sulfurtransferase
MKSVIVHYQEIALKGKNRPWFIARLVRNIRQALSDLDIREVRVLMGRIEVVLGPSATWESVRDRLALVFGIGNFSRAGRARLDVEAIADEILKDLGPDDPETFRVSARRADKRFPLTSPQIEREVGGRIKQARNWLVDLDRPALTIQVEALTSEAFYSFGKERGPGGLPVGSSGRVACLLSGGIDSPVAAWRMMRRGLRCDFVHFSGRPFTGPESTYKAYALASRLDEHQGDSRLWVVQFGRAQRALATAGAGRLQVLSQRRLMVRVAAELARREGCEALVTGDSLGQVASQTLTNLSVVGDASDMLLLRPLVAMDKSEIVDEARRLGTYDVSIMPDEDCCQLFSSTLAVTRGNPDDLRQVERTADVADLVDDLVASAELFEPRFARTPAPRPAGVA